jgi:hypothetical protein
VRSICLTIGFASLLITGLASSAAAQSEAPSVDLVVDAGRPLRVALDERIHLQKVGQVVTGRVTEPVYAYDRVVIDVGTRVRGQVVRIVDGSKWSRMRAYAGGNYSPPKQAVLQFDTIVLDDGRELSISTIVTGGIPHVVQSTAAGSSASVPPDGELTSTDDIASPTLGARARAEIHQQTTTTFAAMKQKASDMLATVKSIKEPGQMSRLKDAAIQQLPYHPQYLAKGTVYDAALLAPVSFGRVVPATAASVGTVPAPNSILKARLGSTLDSSKTPRGTPFEAVVTQTVFSADHKVIFPEGTKLTGEVTFAKPARSFHRNGQLRFLFERVQVPQQPSVPLLGALHAIDANADDRVAVDDEGGATLENSKTRFIAPALAVLSLRASINRDGHQYDDPDGDGSIKTAGSGAGSRAVGGFLGMSLIGVVVSQVTRPLGIAMGVYGAARTVYSNVLSKGREVTFAADTPIQVRLAPGPSAPQ